MLPGGRGAPSRGRGDTCCDGDADLASTPKNPGGEIVGGPRFFFGADRAATADTAPDEMVATGTSACDGAAPGTSLPGSSRPTSRRGQEESSTRPAGAASGSPFTNVRAASASTAAGRVPGPPSSSSVPTDDATSGTIGPARGRGAGPPGRAFTSGMPGSLGSATGTERAASNRVISRST